MSTYNIVAFTKTFQDLEGCPHSDTDVFIRTSPPMSFCRVEDCKSVAVDDQFGSRMVGHQVEGRPYKGCSFCFSDMLSCGTYPLLIQCIVNNIVAIPVKKMDGVICVAPSTYRNGPCSQIVLILGT